MSGSFHQDVWRALGKCGWLIMHSHASYCTLMHSRHPIELSGILVHSHAPSALSHSKCTLMYPSVMFQVDSHGFLYQQTKNIWKRHDLWSHSAITTISPTSTWHPHWHIVFYNEWVQFCAANGVHVYTM